MGRKCEGCVNIFREILTHSEKNGMIISVKEGMPMKFPDWKQILRTQSGSILMIVCGAVLAVKPDSASMVLSAILGWIAIAAGVALIVAGLLEGRQIRMIVNGVFWLMAGSLIHRHPLAIASVLGVLMGFLVLSQGVRTAKTAKRARRSGSGWILVTVLAAQLLVGIRLLFSPLSISRLVLSVAGIVMVICGVCAMVADRREETKVPGKSRIIDADE